MPTFAGHKQSQWWLACLVMLLAAPGCGESGSSSPGPAPEDEASATDGGSSSAPAAPEGGRSTDSGAAPNQGGSGVRTSSGGAGGDGTRPGEGSGPATGGAPDNSGGGDRALAGSGGAVDVAGSGGGSGSHAGATHSGGAPSHGQGGTTGGGGSPGRTVKSLPCDVRAVLAARCQGCHADPPQNDAPMPLLTWSDVSNKASDIQDKLQRDEMPPRGEPDLSERQLSTLLDYLALGTPSAGNVSCP